MSNRYRSLLNCLVRASCWLAISIAVLASPLFATGDPCGESAVADAVIMIDKTGSINGTELGEERYGAKALLNFFSAAIIRPFVGIGTFNVVSGPDARIEPSGSLTDVYGHDNPDDTGLYEVINNITGSTGLTDLSAALDVAHAEIAANAQTDNRYIILISDGIANRPEGGGSCPPGNAAALAAIAAANAAKADDIEIFTIHYGDDGGCPAGTGTAFLRDQISSGASFHFEGNGDLSGVFTEIAEYLGCDDHNECTADSCNEQTHLCDYDAIDSDGDGTPDCEDGCPEDPEKTSPGQCGCGNPDTDSDGDGTADCIDLCPSDPLKTEPGACGCSSPDIDSDGDSVLDCNDLCANFDDAQLGAPCTVGLGACESGGITQCGAEGGGFCSGTALQPSPEICDQIDNDCDGLIDEGLNCTLDCFGVPGGSAVLDQCGVCGGDGSSCIACVDVTISGELSTLELDLKQAELNAKRQLRALGASWCGKNAYQRELKAMRRALRNIDSSNRTLVTQVPVVITNCNPGVSCTDADNRASKESLRSNSQQLVRLASKASKLRYSCLVGSCSGDIAACRERVRARVRLTTIDIRRARSLHRAVLATLNTVPDNTQQCSSAS